MSVNLISATKTGEPDARNQPNEYTPPPGSTDDKKLDLVIASAMEKIPSATDDDAPPRSKKNLDDTISEGQERLEAAEAERQSFAESRTDREELQSYYSNHGDFKTTLQAFSQFAEAFKADPKAAHDRFIEAFIGMTPYSIKERPKAKDDGVWTDEKTGIRHSGKKLSALIDDAYENATRERETFEATEAERATLKQLFPGASFAESVKRLAALNRDAIRDPVGVAQILAGAFGFPVTENQQRDYAVKKEADTAVLRATQQLPGMDKIRPAMANVIADPNFVSTGSAEGDLQKAYNTVVYQHQQTAHFDNWAIAQLQRFEKTDPAFARSVVDTIFKDKAFQDHAASTAPDLVSRFHAAVAWTKSKMQLTRHALSRAQRVKPVKSSSGAVPNGSGKGGLDSAIGAAMKDY